MPERRGAGDMKLSHIFRVVAVVLVMTCAWSRAAVAQSDRGTITGTVTDASGGALANAKVTALNTNNGASQDATTTGEGSYTIPELPAGPYTVTATATGFK